ncbi:MAG: threonine ammonia-lyase [Armatimonadetes bacterium]|nr:threonine ammonia-lyase [Armatimonadota bacterium]
MITARDIAAAWPAVQRVIKPTPCPLSEPLSHLFGGPVYLKMENLQVTGSFKERGALVKLSSLLTEERHRGVITASAGNHAQAVAYHARRLHITATIVMPVRTPLIKVLSTKELGGQVIQHGDGFDDAYEEALRRAKRDHLVFIPPFDDDLVITGQGSIGLEILEQVPDVTQVVVPIGGGGLISGIATAMKAARPKLRVVGVEAAAYPSMQASLKSGQVTPTGGAGTLADGIAVKKVSERTLAYVQKYVDKMVAVEEPTIARSILLLLERQKSLAEGAAAATVAALLEDKVDLNGPTVLVISGGNIDISRLDDIIVRGLAADGRRVRLKVVMPDLPGQLHRLTGIIARLGANIIDVFHDREFGAAGLGKTMPTVTLETRGEEHVAELLTALAAEGFEAVDRVAPAARVED